MRPRHRAADALAPAPRCAGPPLPISVHPFERLGRALIFACVFGRAVPFASRADLAAFLRG